MSSHGLPATNSGVLDCAIHNQRTRSVLDCTIHTSLVCSYQLLRPLGQALKGRPSANRDYVSICVPTR